MFFCVTGSSRQFPTACRATPPVARPHSHLFVPFVSTMKIEPGCRGNGGKSPFSSMGVRPRPLVNFVVENHRSAVGSGLSEGSLQGWRGVFDQHRNSPPRRHEDHEEALGMLFKPTEPVLANRHRNQSHARQVRRHFILAGGNNDRPAEQGRHSRILLFLTGKSVDAGKAWAGASILSTSPFYFFRARRRSTVSAIMRVGSSVSNAFAMDRIPA